MSEDRKPKISITFDPGSGPPFEVAWFETEKSMRIFQEAINAAKRAARSAAEEE